MTSILLEDAQLRAQWRQRLLAARRALAPELWQARNEALCQALQQWWQTWYEKLATQEVLPWVGLYWPMKGEPDVRALFAHWPKRALPAAVAADAPLQFRVWRSEGAMTEDCYGIPTPATAETVRPHLVLVPLVGFNASGFRLGYGGGFYDRTLALWRREGWSGVTVGVGFADAEVADLTPAPHDEPLDLLVTDAGVRYCSAAAKKKR